MFHPMLMSLFPIRHVPSPLSLFPCSRCDPSPPPLPPCPSRSPLPPLFPMRPPPPPCSPLPLPSPLFPPPWSGKCASEWNFVVKCASEGKRASEWNPKCESEGFALFWKVVRFYLRRQDFWFCGPFFSILAAGPQPQAPDHRRPCWTSVKRSEWKCSPPDPSPRSEGKTRRVKKATSNVNVYSCNVCTTSNPNKELRTNTRQNGRKNPRGYA